MSHYTITPLEKKSVEANFELFRQDPNTGMSQWLNIKETYRWGKGFIAEDMDCNLPSKDSTQAYCRMDAGELEGCDFDDGVSLEFDFDSSITEEEKEEIKESYVNGGAGWIYDGEHEWEIEDDYVIVYGPFKVELCNENGEVIKEVQHDHC